MSENKVKIVFLMNKTNPKSFFYLPSNSKEDYVNRTKEIIKSFINLDRGEIHIKSENYYYLSYPSKYKALIDKISSRYFIFIVTEKNFDYKLVDAFLEDLIQNFELEKIVPEANKISGKTKKLLIQSYNKFLLSKDDIKKGFQESTAIEMTELPKEDEKIQNEKEEDSSKNLDGKEDEGTINTGSVNIEEDKQSSSVLTKQKTYLRQNAETHRLTWWGRLKVSFIVICLILAIGLYISIPFLMRYKRNHTSDESTDSE